MFQARLFSQGVDLFAVKFYLDRVVPHQPFLASKLETLGYPMVKAACRIRLRSLVFDTMPLCDGLTDTGGRTYGFAVA